MGNDNKGRDIFYGIVAIATLIVAIIGATLAYFSITASSNEGAINATSATVSIEYNDGKQVSAQADKLIPATLEVVKKVYEETIANLTDDDYDSENACIDHNNRQVCSVYRFTIRSDSERTITARLNNEHNGFQYLSYAVYDVTKKEWLKLNDEGSEDLALTACSNENETEDDDCYTTNPKTYVENRSINSLFGYTREGLEKVSQSKKVTSEVSEYELVLFIKENDTNQNIDQGQQYRGTLVVEVLDGGANGQITGCVGDDCLED